MILSHYSVCLCAKTYYDISQDTIIHIHTALPQNLPGIDLKCISLLNVVVKQSRQ